MAIHTCQRSQPSANSLQAHAHGEFAGTLHSLSLYAIGCVKDDGSKRKRFFKPGGLKKISGLLASFRAKNERGKFANCCNVKLACK